MIPGTSHFPGERDSEYSRMAMGIAWPARRAGFVVVVGEHKLACVGGKPRLDVLDEASDERLWHVVEKAAALRAYYNPEIALADAFFWTPAQAAFLREKIQEDADWAEIVDQLNLMLRR